MRFAIALLMALTCSPIMAHELTPTYPELKPSIYDNVLETSIILFNRREDVLYYEIEVWDENWNSVPFATAEKIVEVPYLGKKRISVYFRNKDQKRVVYICTRSKIIKGESTSVISSNICSKVK